MLEAFRNQHGGGGGRGGGGYGPRGYGMMGPRGRPGPYDRYGGGGMSGYGRGYGPNGPRGSRNFKGAGQDGYGYGGSGGGGYGMGYGGGMGMGMGGGMGGSLGGNMAGKSGHMIRMRGLPFRVTETDIAEWFSSVTDPIAINIRYNNQGRPAGEADVLFSTEAEAKKAMAKDRQNMQHRYVELFYDGPVGSAAPSTGVDTGGWGQGMSAGSSGAMTGGMGGNNGMAAGNSSGMGMGGSGGMNSVGFANQMPGAEGNDYGAY